MILEREETFDYELDDFGVTVEVKCRIIEEMGRSYHANDPANPNRLEIVSVVFKDGPKAGYELDTDNIAIRSRQRFGSQEWRSLTQVLADYAGGKL